MADNQSQQSEGTIERKPTVESEISWGTAYGQINQKYLKNKENIEPESNINFSEVAASNLTMLHSNICQETSGTQPPQKIQFRQNVDEKEKPEKSENKKNLLFAENNLESGTFERPAMRKPSLVTSGRSKAEKGKKNKGQNQKNEQNYQSQSGVVSQKHVKIRSENTVKYIPEDQFKSTQISQRNYHEEFESAQKLFTDLSREFQYAGDFAAIRKELTELATLKYFYDYLRKIKIIQNTSDFVTIKATSSIDYCHCLLKSCINVEEMGGIYQLKNSVYKRNKAKFILITGNESDFLKFFRMFLIRLWDLKCLKLKKDQLVEFYVNSEKQNPQLKELKKEYTHLYNQLSGLSGEQTRALNKCNSNSFILSIKENINKLLPPTEKKATQKIAAKFKQVLDYNEKINNLFVTLKHKLFALEESHEYEPFLLERELQTEIYFHEFPVWKLFGFFYKTEYEKFGQKCGEILKNYSMRKIFAFLEIQEQYSLFVVQKCKTTSLKDTMENDEKIKSCQQLSEQQKNGKENPPIPYQDCVKIIESMDCGSLVPSKFLEKACLFYKQLRQFYSQLYSEKSVVRTCSMDDELPITIFIMLMAGLGDSRSAAMNFLGKVRWMMKWVEHKEANASSDSSLEGHHGLNSEPTSEDFASKKKILTMLDSAFVFVIKEWAEHEQEEARNQKMQEMLEKEGKEYTHTHRQLS